MRFRISREGETPTQDIRKRNVFERRFLCGNFKPAYSYTVISHLSRPADLSGFITFRFKVADLSGWPT